jgi:hypothetical protein
LPKNRSADMNETPTRLAAPSPAAASQGASTPEALGIPSFETMDRLGRAVTARGFAGVGPILLATCSRAWARLGPFSTAWRLAASPRYRRWVATVPPRPPPNLRVAWRFPDWTAVGCARAAACAGHVSRTLFLGSDIPSRPLPAGPRGRSPHVPFALRAGSDHVSRTPDALGPARRFIGGLSPRGPPRHWRQR